MGVGRVNCEELFVCVCVCVCVGSTRWGRFVILRNGGLRKVLKCGGSGLAGGVARLEEAEDKVWLGGQNL